jgi:pyruvate formate lyase activating enzyme
MPVDASAPSPVYGILKNPSLVDFPGHLARVFFLSGCNFACDFCHNADLATPRPGLPWRRILEVLAQDRRQWVDGVVISGGEPTLAPELPELIDHIRASGYAVKLDTNGSRPDVLALLFDRLDYVAMDLKCPIEEYPSFVGFNRPDQVRASIELVRSRARDYEFRTTVLADYHTEVRIRTMAESIREARRYVLQPFLPRDDLPGERRRTAPRTPPDLILKLAEIARPFVKAVTVRGVGL